MKSGRNSCAFSKMVFSNLFKCSIEMEYKPNQQNIRKYAFLPEWFSNSILNTLDK